MQQMKNDSWTKFAIITAGASVIVGALWGLRFEFLRLVISILPDSATGTWIIYLSFLGVLVFFLWSLLFQMMRYWK